MIISFLFRLIESSTVMRNRTSFRAAMSALIKCSIETLNIDSINQSIKISDYQLKYSTTSFR